ncbi:MAG: glycosyl transferase [Polaromonas sp. 17-63-33]|jgi:hypothetical protein|nr:MAG: glycosyl transferase [Polaromonas sp. 24-63-21]OZA47485.1 MAG: glycosyl transferase [Polaromonas sp. 17-63-33]
MNFAPIALFVYNRLSHVQKTIDALQKNIGASSSKLYIFSDGFKSDDDSFKVNKVRNFLKTVTGFHSIEIIERQKNLGLASSIIAGVTEIVNKSGRIIVLEDDLVSSPYFLKYMNEGLDQYESDDKVASIHGYVYPVEDDLPAAFFLRGADCWGWATWKRGWDLFNPSGLELLSELNNKKLAELFDFNGSYPFTKMLEDQIEGKNNSWAIRWNASVFLKDKLTLYPGKSLVSNIGNDGSGTHSSAVTNIWDASLSVSPVNVFVNPVEDSTQGRLAFERYFRRISPNLFGRIIRYVKRKINFIQ